MSDKPKKKVYSNEHPKYKKSKSYSEAEILEFNREVKEKAKDIDSGKIIFKMPVLTGKNKKNTKYHIKKVNPDLRLKILKSKKTGSYSTEV
tara:strand:+ start:364 stop:636 length:273 start_codon:yes stop_codon:yes gene_type:complete